MTRRSAFWPCSVLAVVGVSLLVTTACQYKRAAMEFRAARRVYGDVGTEEYSTSREQTQSVGVTRALVSSEIGPTSIPRKIIRNGSLELVVVDVDQSNNKIRSIVEGLGGFVEKATQTNVNGRTATITVRVPAD